MIERGQTVAIIGAGVTGRSAARYVARQGGVPVVLDTRAAPADNRTEDLPRGTEVRWAAAGWPGDMDAALAVVSPGLPLDACLLQGARAAGVTLYSDIDLFFTAVDKPVIGITGTNGKSTVTSLAGHLLNRLGVDAGVGGNLGDAALDIIAPHHACYVLELSSFQLERSRQQSFFRAVILNVSEDHLDHHGGLDAYIAAKQRIYAKAQGCVVNRAQPHCQPGPGASLVSYGLDAPDRPQDWGVRKSAGRRWLCRGEQQLCDLQTLPLQGGHNEENVLAACALVYDLAQPGAAALADALHSFKGLPHRFAVVGEHQGVTYINDSKATNLGATLAALQGMPAAGQVVLIAGGDAKGVDLSPLQPALRGRVKHMVLLGQAAAHLQTVAAAAAVPATLAATLAEAVGSARRQAVHGDVVLLSPACSSLDMFASFAQRGEQFAQLVQALEDGG